MTGAALSLLYESLRKLVALMAFQEAISHFVKLTFDLLLTFMDELRHFFDDKKRTLRAGLFNGKYFILLFSTVISYFCDQGNTVCLSYIYNLNYFKFLYL